MTAPAIELDAVTKNFGRHRGVTDVSVDVRSGEIFGFLGPNGAGKSTTIKLILGLYRPSAGRLRVLGRDPLTDPIAVHRAVGYLPGELALFPRLTGREHLDWIDRGRGASDHRLRDELTERFGVELDRPVRTLSKGNRQKIGILLAFGHRPDLLVLDEPTSGLDPLLQNEFERLLAETVADGRTVFLSSHELDEVQRSAHRVAIIREGRIVVVDTVDGLRRSAPPVLEFTFPAGVDVTTLRELDGVEVIEQQGRQVRLSVTGRLGPLLQEAGRLDPIDLTARPADLDELFLRYYRTSDPAHTRPVAR
jgi:ABC-2 type transport system ATP-binding protein